MNQRVQISKKLLLVNSVSSAVARVINVAVMLWVVRYLYQMASAEIPVLYVVTSVIMIIPIFTAIFTWALSRHVTEAYAQGDDSRVTEITSTMFAVLVPVGLLIFALGLVLIQHVDAVLEIPEGLVTDARIMLSLLFVQVVIRLVAAPFAVGLFVQQRFVMLNVIDTSSTILRVVLLAVLFLAIRPRALWMVVAQVAAYAFQDVARVIISVRILPALRFHRRLVRWQTATSLIGFNTWAIGNHLAWFLHDSAPPLALNRFGTWLDTNTLYLPAMADVQLRTFVQTATIPLLPILTAMQATDQMQRLRNSFLRGCRWLLWLVMYLVVCLVVFRDEVMRVLQANDPTYAHSGIVLGLLLTAYFSYLPRLMLMKVAFAMGHIRAAISLNLASQLCNLGVMLYLVAYLRTGAVGVAISTLSIEVVWFVLVWGPLSAWLIRIPLSQFVREGFLWGCAPAVACALFCQLLQSYIHPIGVIPVGLCMLAGLPVYIVVLLSGCLTNADRADFRRLKAKLVSLAARSGGRDDETAEGQAEPPGDEPHAP